MDIPADYILQQHQVHSTGHHTLCPKLHHYRPELFPDDCFDLLLASNRLHQGTDLENTELNIIVETQNLSCI